MNDDDLAIFIMRARSEPRRVRLWRQVRQQPIRALHGAMIVRFALQRIRRGWDTRALWDLDHHLCATLGEQLLCLADTDSGGIPEHYPDEASWATDLRRHGRVLQRYGARLDHEDDDLAAAKDALIWVSNNLEHLWD